MSFAMICLILFPICVACGMNKEHKWVFSILSVIGVVGVVIFGVGGCAMMGVGPAYILTHDIGDAPPVSASDVGSLFVNSLGLAVASFCLFIGSELGRKIAQRTPQQ